MVSVELIAIAGVLILQPLIALIWAYFVYRLAVRFLFNRAEKAVDGRIEKVGKQLERITGGSD